jgi:5-formyltetrahydrofolate cyclo-ligase
MKTEIRAKLIQLRREKIDIYEKKLFLKLKKNFLSLVNSLQCSKIAGYYPLRNEINLLPILFQAYSLGYEISLPKVVRSSLQFKEWKKGDLLIMNSKYKILEPSKESNVVIPDLIIVPLLGFDRSCHRLGYGKGYYDRTLKQYKKAISVGIGYSFQEVDKLPINIYDISLDYIVTEKEIIVKHEKNK